MHSSNILQDQQVKFYQPDILQFGMAKMHIKQILARNLRAAMERKYGKGNHQSKLSRDTKGEVAAKTISNYLAANKLPDNDLDLASIPSASISHLSVIAAVLDTDVWQLLHPDPEKALREQEFYKRIEQDFRNLPQIQVEADAWPEQDRRHTERRQEPDRRHHNIPGSVGMMTSPPKKKQK